MKWMYVCRHVKDLHCGVCRLRQWSDSMHCPGLLVDARPVSANGSKMRWLSSECYALKQDVWVSRSLAAVVHLRPLDDVVSWQIVALSRQAKLDAEILGLTSIVEGVGGFVVGQMRWLTTGTPTLRLGRSSVRVSPMVVGKERGAPKRSDYSYSGSVFSVFTPHGLLFHLDTEVFRTSFTDACLRGVFISRRGRCFILAPEGIEGTAACWNVEQLCLWVMVRNVCSHFITQAVFNRTSCMSQPDCCDTSVSQGLDFYCAGL